MYKYFVHAIPDAQHYLKNERAENRGKKKVRKLKSQFFAYKTLINDRISINFGLQDADLYALGHNMSKYFVRPILSTQRYFKNEESAHLESWYFAYKTLINGRISINFEL